jgi:outer membrane protein TolC
VQKTLYSGNKLSSEIAQAEAKLESQAEIVKASFRIGKKAVETSQQTISSMGKAIDLAVENAKNSLDEIDYLRKQLIIGQSTLDSVLSAEARLYDAQSKEINFVTERKMAELTLLNTFSLLTNFFNLD